MRYLSSHHPELTDAYAKSCTATAPTSLAPTRRPGSPIIGAAASAVPIERTGAANTGPRTAPIPPHLALSEAQPLLRTVVSVDGRQATRADNRQNRGRSSKIIDQQRSGSSIAEMPALGCSPEGHLVLRIHEPPHDGLRC